MTRGAGVFALALAGALLAAGEAQAQLPPQYYVPAPPPPPYASPTRDYSPGWRAREATGRPGFLFGAGLGGGRIQDKVTGFGGLAFDLQLGYAPVRDFAFVVDADGLVDPMSDGGSLIDGGVALSVEGRVADRVRLSLGGGYYWLEHYTSQSSGDGGPTAKFGSFGGEAGLGVEIFQTSHGLSGGIFARNQVSFPNGQLVDSAFALFGFRWSGLGGAPERPAPPPPSASAPVFVQDGSTGDIDWAAIWRAQHPEVEAPTEGNWQPPPAPLPPPPPPVPSFHPSDPEPPPPPPRLPPGGAVVPLPPSSTVSPFCDQVASDLRRLVGTGSTSRGWMDLASGVGQCIDDGLDWLALVVQDRIVRGDSCEPTLQGVFDSAQKLVSLVNQYAPELLEYPPVAVIVYALTSDHPFLRIPRAFMVRVGIHFMCDPERADRARQRARL